MQYLIRRKGNKQKAHLWNGKDTFCKMASTGGLIISKFSLFNDTNGKEICVMCKNNFKKVSNS